jgi:hypothetical protein
MANLKQHGTVIRANAIDNEGWFPDDLDRLVSGEGLVSKRLLFKCPSAASDSPVIENNNIDTTTISYMYSNSTGSPSTPYVWSEITVETDTPLFSDRKGNHRRADNVVLGDAHVEQIVDNNWRQTGSMAPPNPLPEMVDLDQNYDPEGE